VALVSARARVIVCVIIIARVLTKVILGAMLVFMADQAGI